MMKAGGKMKETKKNPVRDIKISLIVCCVFYYGNLIMTRVGNRILAENYPMENDWIIVKLIYYSYQAMLVICPICIVVIIWKVVRLPLKILDEVKTKEEVKENDT